MCLPVGVVVGRCVCVPACGCGWVWLWVGVCVCSCLWVGVDVYALTHSFAHVLCCDFTDIN